LFWFIVSVSPDQEPPELVPTKTTSTAAYAAVAPSTSFPVLSSANNASTSAKRKVATETVITLVFWDGWKIMMSIGPIRAAPPNIAMMMRAVKAFL
jgi:hypothetical protein